MRILVVHPSSELYGADRMTEVSVRALIKSGYSVTVVVPVDGALVENLIRTGAAVEILDTPALRKGDLHFRGMLKLLFKVAGSIFLIVKTIRRVQPDVIYVNSIIQPWWIAVGKLLRKPVIVHVREAETGVSRYLQLSIYSPLLLAGTVLCNSRSTLHEISRVFPRLSATASVIYNGKDWSQYEVKRVGSQPNSSESTAHILLVGRLNPRKGQDIALHALAGLIAGGIGATLTFAGDVFPGYEWYETELRDLARDLDVTDYVHFVGFQSDISKLLEESDIAVVPSRIEPFGTVAAECMAACLPTVVADIDGLAEIVCSDEVGLTFPVGDYDELTRQLEWLVSNPIESRAMALRGKESVLERFSLRRYESEVIAHIERAASGCRP